MIRKEKGMTQNQLGEACGIDAANIRKYELGKQNPKYETLEKIANAVDLPVSFFTGQPPFSNLPLLLQSKGVVLFSLRNNGYFSKDIIASQVSACEYMKMVAEYIADVKEASNNYLDISYKTKSAPEQHDKVKYITRALQIELGPEQMHLVLVYNRLNEKGQSIAVERIEELAKIPDYQKIKDE